MAINATVQLVDSLGRVTTKTYETETEVLATAQANVASLITDLEAVTDLGVVSVTYSLKDDTEASAAGAGSNVDEGATFRVRLNDGFVAAHKIPGFPISKAIAGGAIPIDDSDVENYFDNFVPAGLFTLNRGNTVSELISGQMDK